MFEACFLSNNEDQDIKDVNKFLNIKYYTTASID